MTQLQGSHEDYTFEAFWDVQGQTLYWGAVVRRDGQVVSRPQGHVPCAALEGEPAQAVRELLVRAIEAGIDVTPPASD